MQTKTSFEICQIRYYMYSSDEFPLSFVDLSENCLNAQGTIMTNNLDQAKAKLAQAQAELEQAMSATADHPAEALVEAAGRADSAITPEKSSPKPAKKPGTSRGIETLFRSSYRVQMDLTGLADNKANMMISINSIILSIILAAVAPKLDANPWLLLPTLILMVGNLVSIIYAIQAARPRVIIDPISLQDLHNSKGNILFFGNFANLHEDEFVQGITEMMEDKTLIYETMIRNIYGLGSVLNRKFALLQKAYTSFMVALILGVCSFIIVFVWLSQQN